MTRRGSQGVFLNFEEQMRLDVAQKVLIRDLTIKDAAKLLQLSERQARRVIDGVKKRGALGVKHGNCGRVPANKTPDQQKQFILELLRERYFDFNLSHFLEKLEREHGIRISHECLRVWAHSEGLVKRSKKAGRKVRSHKRRPRMPAAGMLLQLDGSKHRWFGRESPEFALIGAIDDATSLCPHAEIFPAEDTISVLAVLKRIVETVGVPEVLYVDQAGHFGSRLNKALRLDWEKHLTHVERAMNEIGCRVLFASTPQAKGRIERMWDTFQDRLVPELRLRGIKRIPAANAYLADEFIPDFNQRFSVPPVKKKQVYKPVPKIWKDRLDWVFCKREFRKVDLGECISWNGRTYLVSNNYGLTLKRCQLEIRNTTDGRTQAFFAGRTVSLTDIGSTVAINLKAA